MEKFTYFALVLWEMKITTFLKALLVQLQAFGVPGLFLISLLDSAFIPLPAGPDALLVTIASQGSKLQSVEYILAATMGSVIGCLILYLIAQRGGEKVLQKISVEKRDYVQGLLGRYDALAIVLASIMPPPFPFKPFILIAGVIKFRLPRLVLALFIGRALRYTILALLALYFGEAAIGLIKKYGIWIVVGMLVIGLVVYLFKRFTTKASVSKEPVNETE